MASATAVRENVLHTAGRPWFWVWLATFGALTTLVTLLSIAIKNDPLPSQDVTVLNNVSGWDVWGLTAALGAVSFLTNNFPALILGIGAVGFLWLLGLNREAFAFAIIGGIVGAVAFLGDFTLAEIVDRGRPTLAEIVDRDRIIEDKDVPSFPSGHVFGSTVFFGFWGFLGYYYGLKKKLLVPWLMMMGVLIVGVGIARIHLQAHWPSDVAAGYLLGGLWLMVLIPFFLYIRNATWFPLKNLKENLTVVACEDCRVEQSIASVVVLNPDEGTATKVYKPPPLVGLLYWIAFQAKFPYTSNVAALEAAAHRRTIASLLTRHRFGKDLVAAATATTCEHGDCSFVTEYVPGEKAENDAEAQSFLGEVAETFAEAGLSVWQINPRNPHAHTNLIKTAEGDFKIIDLESAVVTLLPAPGQWRSSLRRGTIPIFDDIDFQRLRDYIATNEAALVASLGAEGLAELRDAAERCEAAIQTWQNAEPRIPGRVVSTVYRTLNIKAHTAHLRSAITGADAAAIAFLKGGIERWEGEGRIEKERAESVRSYLSSGKVDSALHHMGVHMVLSVAIAIPIPGLRSAARFLWTLVFWFKAQFGRLRRRPASAGPRPVNIHNPLVMFIALIPVFGAVAYLAARPLRQKILVRLMLDQSAWKLPFKLYRRLHLGRWLAPPIQQASPAQA